MKAGIEFWLLGFLALAGLYIMWHVLAWLTP